MVARVAWVRNVPRGPHGVGHIDTVTARNTLLVPTT